MKRISFGTLAFGMVGAFAVTLAVIGAPSSRPAPRAIATTSSPPAPPSVSARGFTLTSVSDDPPSDDAQYPDGPHADVINANCTSCHSASMALTQPRLSADQWKAIVSKMRETYHAPVGEDDIQAIVTYLISMPGQGAVAQTGKAIDPSRENASDAAGITG